MLTIKVLHLIRLLQLMAFLGVSFAEPSCNRNVGQSSDIQLCGLFDDGAAPNSFINCQACTWPGSAEPAQQFAVTTVDTVRINRINVDPRNFQTLFSVRARILRLLNINRDDGTTFPFRDFVRGLPKDAVEYLEINSVSLGGIDQRAFEGFSSLIDLRLVNANLQVIHPDSFQHFAVNGPQNTRFEGLQIHQDKSLTSFPWASLRHFTKSLKSVSLPYNRNLIRIIYDGTANDMQLTALADLGVSHSGISVIPQSVLDTFINVQKTSPTAVFFAYNRNKCRDSGLSALLKWVKTSNGQDRYLDATCNKDDGTVSHFSGKAEQWLDCGSEQVCQ